MENRLRSASWLNIALSIERIFREAFPDIPVYRFALPQDVADQRNLFESEALFLQLVPGEIDLWQETYCTMWLCHKHSPQRRFTPESNLYGVWIQEQAQRLQQWLDKGGDNASHLWPLYDYRALIPDAVYQSFLSSGDDTELTPYVSLSPVKIENTGFVVKGGSTRPTMTMTQNPMFLEWTLTFMHCNREAYQGLKG